MNKTMIALAVGVAALLGGSAANAAGPDVKAKNTTEATATDVSSRGRHHSHMHRYHRHYGMYRGHHYRYGGYRPYYNSYGYSPSYGYAQRPYGYYGGGPGVSFSFGS